MRLCVLGSGSGGNVAFIEAGQGASLTRVIVDAGLSRREIARRLGEAVGLGVEDLHAVVVTHDHRDHVGCAAKLERPVYAPGATLRTAEIEGTRVLSGRSFRIGAITVHPVLLPHDAEETVGYVFEADGARAGILTDCGWDDPSVAAAYANCALLVLETNHDRALLASGPYPPSLKRRVGGTRGHLSNAQSASLLQKIIAKSVVPPRVVVAAHLSQANNRPDLARAALFAVLGARSELHVAAQDAPSRVFEVVAVPSQLSLLFQPTQSVSR